MSGGLDNVTFKVLDLEKVVIFIELHHEEVGKIQSNLIIYTLKKKKKEFLRNN